MSSFVSDIYNKIYSQLPQNEHTAKAEEIKTQVQGLTAALADATNDVFKNNIIETKKQLEAEKETCLSSLTRLNGEFFQDPRSTLKKAWDKVVSTVHGALNIKIESRNELQTATNLLDARSNDKTIEKAKNAIGVYTLFEKDRDRTELRLNEIINTEKADPITPLSENALRQRQKELCGDHYEDPNSLLDKAWKEYQQALKNSDPSAPNLLNAYHLLENERKSNALLLEHINSAAPARNIEAWTARSISNQIASLNAMKVDEDALAGVDWKKTAANATTIAAIATGYAFTYVPVGTTL